MRRTRALLLEAFGALVHEKPYDDIVVKEILQRADVGRSTFYAHFSDKEQLLSSALSEVLRGPSGKPSARALPYSERVIRFARPLLEHIARHPVKDGSPLANALDERARSSLHRRLEREIAQFAAEELRRCVREQGSVRIPVEVLAGHVAGTFSLVLEWWAGNERRQPALEIDALFRTLVLPVLSRALD